MCHLTVDGVSSGTINLPSTGGQQVWRTALGPAFTVSGASNHKLRFYADAGGFNLNYVTLSPVGTISGTVTSPTAGPVSGATITVEPDGYTATTGSNGTYTISNVAIGSYSVTASKAGFTSQTVSGASVTQGGTATASFSLTEFVTKSSLSAAKARPDGEGVSVANVTVTGIYGSSFYVEDQDRSAGLRVSGATTHAIGDVVTVQGILNTVNGERQLVQAVVTP